MVPQVGGMVVYYFLFGEKITAFPPGFVVVAGDANRRNASVRTPNIPQSLWGPDDKTPEALAEKATGFTCLNYGGHSEDGLARHMLPNTTFIDANCANGLRLEPMFPRLACTGHHRSESRCNPCAYSALAPTGMFTCHSECAANKSLSIYTDGSGIEGEIGSAAVCPLTQQTRS
ncbi:hypothetical protein B5807_12164, partial [Epicoccum nigrum]